MRPDFLSGIRFTDLTWAGAGPFGTKVFSDFGAEVIKVESSTRPDSVRIGGPYKDGKPGINRSGYFASRNTGKKSITVDLKQKEGHELVMRLIAQSDVVSNNFGPGAMSRLGLDYETVAAAKPDIIYLSMPMYGDEGPAANLLGVGMTISAVTSLMFHTAYAPGDAVGPGTHYPDHAANPYHAAFAVVAALRYKRRTGRGMKIDLSQVESTVSFAGPQVVAASVSGEDPPQIGNRSTVFAPQNIFACRGVDSWCALSVQSDSIWPAFARTIGRADLAADPELATVAGRIAARERLEKVIGDWMAEQEAEEAAALLRQAGVAAATVAHSRSLIEDDPQLRARHYWTHVDHPEMGETLYTSPPYRVDGERVELQRPPLLGEQTDEVLGSILGLKQDQIDDLRARLILS